ncbi:MAG: HNH endonuclease [Candidatus Izemoplasmatales bacterium]
MKSNSGYIIVYYPKNSVYDGGGILEHRFIMEQILGRSLTSKEEVHHLDLDKTNNSPKNLILCRDRKEHKAWHHKINLIKAITFCSKRHTKNTRRKELVVCKRVEPSFMTIKKPTKFFSSKLD